MIELPGYELQQELYNNAVIGVYRALNLQTNKNVVMKVLLEEYPNADDIAKLKHEYNMLKNINSSRVVKVHDLIK